MRRIIAAVMSLFSMSLDAKENFYPSGPWLVSIDGPFICQTSSGERIEFDPKTIDKIKIITNDKGPFEDDVFWKFEYAGGECYFPSEADKEGSFLSYFQELKGFDNAALIESMSSAQNAVFLVWDRSAL